MEKAKKSIFKKTIGWLHRWLGLSSGIIVFIVSVTGCIYAFQAEIKQAIEPYRYTAAQDKAMLPPSALRAIAEEALPGKKVHAVMYTAPGNSAQVIFYSFEPEYFYLVYLNPYTGEILKVKDEEADFFHFILDGHFYLWMPPTIGQPVVATATLIFLVMLISGLILWWPRNKGAAKQRFSIRWSARWKRKNYDLHNVLGFYATWIAIILAVTGLVWGFQWFAQGLHTIAGGKSDIMYSEPLSDTTAVAAAGMPAGDRIWMQVSREVPRYGTMEVHVPEFKASPIVVTVNPDANTYWQTDYRYFDQYTLKELSVNHVYGRLDQANAGDKLLRMNYDIHTGAVIGLPGKILAFFASLICASLPVTGFYIWWGRRKKQQEDDAVLKRPQAARSNRPVMRRPVAKSI